MTDHRPAGIADTDVYITRAFDAPRALVWRFWTEPEHVAKWFGPDEVHVPVESVSIDMRAGGHWNLTMVDNATGAAYPLTVTIIEVVEPEYFIGETSAQTSEGALENVRLHVQFHDHGDKTRVTLHQGPFTAEFRDMTIAGWEASFVTMDRAFAQVSE